MRRRAQNFTLPPCLGLAVSISTEDHPPRSRPQTRRRPRAQILFGGPPKDDQNLGPRTLQTAVQRGRSLHCGSRSRSSTDKRGTPRNMNKVGLASASLSLCHVRKSTSAEDHPPPPQVLLVSASTEDHPPPPQVLLVSASTEDHPPPPQVLLVSTSTEDHSSPTTRRRPAFCPRDSAFHPSWSTLFDPLSTEASFHHL
jgi:hypothetical protein